MQKKEYISASPSGVAALLLHSFRRKRKGIVCTLAVQRRIEGGGGINFLPLGEKNTLDLEFE